MSRSLTLSAIRLRIRVLEKRAKEIEDARKKKLKHVASLIARYKLSRADWTLAMKLSKKRQDVRKTAKNKAKHLKRRVAKYADAKGHSWSGRGRPPQWLVAAEKAGKKREAFLVRSNGRDQASLH